MTLELDQLAIRAAEVIAAVDAGEPVLLTRQGISVAVVRPEPPADRKPLVFGLGIGRGPYYMAPDFNDPMMLVDDPEFKGGE